MTMTDTPVAPKPAVKRKAARRKAPAAASPGAKPPSEFAGITAVDCCNGCTVEHCVISEMNVCAHPMKGGLQSALMSNPDVMRRHRAAKTYLARAKIDLTAT